METPKVFESEYRFCLILWENEPVSSRTLVELCRARLGWKPTTTYTVIKRLSERGILKNDHSVVTSLVSKEAVQAALDEVKQSRVRFRAASAERLQEQRAKLEQKPAPEEED